MSDPESAIRRAYFEGVAEGALKKAFENLPVDSPNRDEICGGAQFEEKTGYRDKTLAVWVKEGREGKSVLFHRLIAVLTTFDWAWEKLGLLPGKKERRFAGVRAAMLELLKEKADLRPPGLEKEVKDDQQFKRFLRLMRQNMDFMTRFAYAHKGAANQKQHDQALRTFAGEIGCSVAALRGLRPWLPVFLTVVEAFSKSKIFPKPEQQGSQGNESATARC